MNLNQITVPTTDIESSLGFYQTLGLKLIVKSAEYARFECPDGESTFSIHVVDKTPNGNGVMVYFECEDLDATVADLKQKGIRFYQEPTDQSWLWREARLYDPANNHLILYYAGKNRKNPPWRIN
ncbi:hypothetical protein GCM10009117_17770 [Gangjinia marincola]|uniref:VOC domain-containing protein n=1 Tax=Gangjinia marincola TaxID=578463 RepID=A0ABP3XT99_9FLAO